MSSHRRSIAEFSKKYPMIWSGISLEFLNSGDPDASFGNRYLVAECDGLYLKFVKDRNIFSLAFCPSNSSEESDWAEDSIILRILDETLNDSNCDSPVKCAFVDRIVSKRWTELVKMLSMSNYLKLHGQIEEWRKLRSEKMFGK